MIPLKHLHIVLIYLAVINVVTFFMYGIDKWKAKNSKWRIRETALLGLAVLGGSIGAWLGMKVWHHKTQHKKFKYGVPAIIIVQLALIVYFTYVKGQVSDIQLNRDHSIYSRKRSPLTHTYGN